MLNRHAVQKLLEAGVRTRAIAQQLHVSRRTVERIAREAPIERTWDGVLQGTVAHQVGRPRVTVAPEQRIQALVLEDGERPPGEICRLLRDEGTPLGLSTVYRVLAGVRATWP